MAGVATIRYLAGRSVFQHQAKLHQFVSISVIGQMGTLDVITLVRQETAKWQASVGAVDFTQYAGHGHECPAAVRLADLPCRKISFKGAE